MLVALADDISFAFGTYDPDTGASLSADAVGAILRDNSGADNAQVPVVTGPLALGQYIATVDVAAIDGVAIGKKYTVWATATVTPSGGGPAVTAAACIGQFEVSGVNHGADLVNTVDGKTPQQAMQYLAAVLAGEIADAGTGTETFKGLDGATDRVKTTVDVQGNRSAVVYDPP